ACRAADRRFEKTTLDPPRELAADKSSPGLGGERARVLVDVAVDLDVDRTAARADLHGLIHELDRRADRHEREEPLHVLGVEPDAAVRHLHADTPRDARAVDPVKAPGELETILAER